MKFHLERQDMRLTTLNLGCHRRINLGLIGLFFCAACLDRATVAQVPRPLTPLTEEILGRKPLNQYGSLENTIRTLRAHRPLDLNAEVWRKANPGRDYHEWAQEARECLATGLHYNPGPVDLKAETFEHVETDSFIRERIEFNTTPWFRVPGYFYTPKNVPLPAPGLVVLHEWGGPMLFGAERVLGPWVIPLMVIPYMMIHFGKPAPEAVGAIIAGATLGIVALRTRAIFAGMIIHIGVAWTMDLLALGHQGKLDGLWGG
jgi:hypothetical protein